MEGKCNKILGRYIIHLYYLAVQACVYRDKVEC